jgi:hypothetical protein
MKIMKHCTGYNVITDTIRLSELWRTLGTLDHFRALTGFFSFFALAAWPHVGEGRVGRICRRRTSRHAGHPMTAAIAPYSGWTGAATTQRPATAPRNCPSHTVRTDDLPPPAPACQALAARGTTSDNSTMAARENPRVGSISSSFHSVGREVRAPSSMTIVAGRGRYAIRSSAYSLEQNKRGLAPRSQSPFVRGV